MLRSEIPEPHPCGDPTCDDDHDAIADRALDGRGAE